MSTPRRCRPPSPPPAAATSRTWWSTRPPAVTTVTDTVDTTTVSLTATPSVAEGGIIVYTASLTSAGRDRRDGDPVATAPRSPSRPAPPAARSASLHRPTTCTSTPARSRPPSAPPAAATSRTWPSTRPPAVDQRHRHDSTPPRSPSPRRPAWPKAAASSTPPALSSAGTARRSRSRCRNGATITIAAGASTGTVSVAAPTDDVYLDAGTVSATITTATGGNFENLAINPAAGHDQRSPTPSTPPRCRSPPRRAWPKAAASSTPPALSAPAQSPVTVTLSQRRHDHHRGRRLHAARVSVAAPTDDVYVDAGSVSATITARQRRQLREPGRQPGCGHHRHHRHDRHHHRVAHRHAQRGRRRQHRLHRLAHQPGRHAGDRDAVQRRARSPSPPAHRSGTVSVAAPTDDVYVDAGTVSATITSATGGNFENLAVNPAAGDHRGHRHHRHHHGLAHRHAQRGRRRQHRLHRRLTSAGAAPPSRVTLSQRRHDHHRRRRLAAAACRGRTDRRRVRRRRQRQRHHHRRHRRQLREPGRQSGRGDHQPSPTRSTPPPSRLTATPSVAEGGSIVYTASLTAPAQTRR